MREKKKKKKVETGWEFGEQLLAESRLTAGYNGTASCLWLLQSLGKPDFKILCDRIGLHKRCMGLPEVFLSNWKTLQAGVQNNIAQQKSLRNLMICNEAHLAVWRKRNAYALKMEVGKKAGRHTCLGYHPHFFIMNPLTLSCSCGPLLCPTMIKPFLTSEPVTPNALLSSVTTGVVFPAAG